MRNLLLSLVALWAVHTAHAGDCIDYLTDTPSPLSTIEHSVGMIRADAGLLFVGEAVGPGFGLLHIYDTSDPSSPVLLSTIPYDDGEGDGVPADMAVVGSVLHVALDGWPFGGARGGYSTVDISDPSNPSKLGFTARDIMLRHLVIDGDRGFAYFRPEAFGHTVYEFDLSDSSNPTIVASFPTMAEDLGLRENVLYVPMVGSIELYDVSVPAASTPVGSIDHEDWWFGDILLDDDRLYAVVEDWSDGPTASRLLVYDVSQPDTPIEIGALEVFAVPVPWNLSVNGGVAYLTFDNELIIASVEDPTNPWVYTLAELPIPVPGLGSAVAPNALWVVGHELAAAFPLQCEPAVDVPDAVTIPRPDVFARAPFARGGKIVVNVPGKRHLTLDVFDAHGRLVRSLHTGVFVGPRALVWDGRDVAGRHVGAGVYLVRVDVDGAVGSTRLILVD